LFNQNRSEGIIITRPKAKMIKRINKLTVRREEEKSFFRLTLSLTPKLGALSSRTSLELATHSPRHHKHGRLMKKFSNRARGISLREPTRN
jgi:hypothetical protein